MIPTTANFDNARNHTGQAPVVVLSLPSLGLLYSSRGGQPGLTPTSTLLRVPSGLAQQISDLQGAATIGALSCEITDVNRAVLPMVASKQWIGAPANLLLGFNGLAYPTDYMTWFSGVVETMVPTADHLGWTITIRDRNRALKSNVYTVGDDGLNPTSKTNPRTLDGNPLALALDFLQTELGIAGADIDTGSITALQNGRFSCTRMLFSLAKAVDGQTFLEQELLRPNGLFHFARYDGKLAIGDMLAAPAPVTVAFAFNDTNIIGIPAFRQAPIYNCVEFSMDYDGSNYLHVEGFVDAASANTYQLQQPVQIQSQGMRTNLQGASRAGVTARRIFQRYGSGPRTQVSLTAAGLQSCIVEVGDYVTVTHRLMENLQTGTVGWSNRVCQVMSVQPKWLQGEVDYDLIDITETLRSAYQYAPDSVPAWTSASSAQKAQYMFMANASEEQSDGTGAAGVF